MAVRRYSCMSCLYIPHASFLRVYVRAYWGIYNFPFHNTDMIRLFVGILLCLACIYPRLFLLGYICFSFFSIPTAYSLTSVFHPVFLYIPHASFLRVYVWAYWGIYDFSFHNTDMIRLFAGILASLACIYPTRAF